MRHGKMGTGLVLGWGLGLASLLAVPGIPARGDEPAKVLFNGKDLSGWHTFIPHKDDPKADPKVDLKGVFKVENGMIHVSGQEFGCLTTDQEFENYRLTVEFKWGEKRWPPRQDAKRDSGILVHCVGPEKVWPRSIECQVQEGDCGDIWLVDGTSIVVDGKKHNGGRVVKKTDAERPTGEWNTIEVVCDGDKMINIVNGVVVSEGSGTSETKGKILLQSEGAEVFYRKVELRPLTRPR
jgi:hypothetical protein